MRRRFSAPAWAWLATAAGLASFVGLGLWQVDRAHRKEHLLSSYGQAAFQPATQLTADTPTLDAGRVLPAVASGGYLADRQLLLDGQSYGGRPGYRVWTPLRLESGALLIVDRGWIAGDPQRPTDLGVDARARTVHGLWRELPRPGLRLAAHAPATQQFPRIVEYPTAEDLAATLGGPVAPGVLLLDAGEADGFLRDWNPTAQFPPSRHYGYAVQWFALAATLVVIFVVVNLKRSS